MHFKRFIFKNKVFFIAILILFLGCCYYYWLHRKPFTQNAFIVADVRPVTALVPGQITHIV